jgi:hypothetical protein
MHRFISSIFLARSSLRYLSTSLLIPISEKPILFIDYELKSTPFGRICQRLITGRSRFYISQHLLDQTLTFSSILNESPAPNDNGTSLPFLKNPFLSELFRFHQ